MKLNSLAMAVAIASGVCVSVSAMADEALPTSTVTANAAEADKYQSAEGQRIGAAEGAQKISADYIKAQQATTFADAMRKTTSVQVDEEGGQQGSLIYIRGFTQDQVSVRVEGAPKNFNQVRHGGAGTVWLEPDMYKAITVVPGVSSNVYGSGSLGGVVLLETKDPEDIIKAGEDWGAAVRAGIETNAPSRYVSADMAKSFNDQFALSATLLRRNTGEYKDAEGNKALQGATGTEDKNGLFKMVATPDEDQRLELSANLMRKHYTARTTTGSGAYGDANDTHVRDDNFTVQYSNAAADNQYLDLNVRYSESTTERRRRLEGSADAWTRWGVETKYAEVENVSLFFQSDDITHSVRYGADITTDEVETAYGDDAQRNQWGAYISDTIAIGESLEVIGSVRYDSFLNHYAQNPAIEETAVSPKLAANFKPFEGTVAEGLAVYGVVGKGFRTPSTFEARSSDEPSCGRRSCTYREANYELKGETSNSWEAGVRFDREGLFTSNDQLNFQAGYIATRAQDYIASAETGEVRTMDVDGTDTAVTITQYQNIDKAKISGFEYSMNYTNDRIFSALSAQNIEGEYASGDSKGMKLPSISPASINFSLGGYLMDGASRVGVDVSHRSQREYVERGVDRTREAYTIYDLFASWQVDEHFLAQLRVENAFNTQFAKRYISSLEAEDGSIEDTTTYQPGRNIKLTLEYTF